MRTGEIIEDTRKLVEIPSWRDEAEAGEFVCDLVGGEIDEVGNVFARKGSGSPEIAFISHLDTVPPSGEHEVRVEGDRIYGRGAADMKGTLVSMAKAFEDAEPQGTLVFASFVGEETNAKGVKHAVKNGFQPDYAVIGEGTVGYTEEGKIDVCVAHRGRREYRVITKGRPSHASQPHLGENAIYSMMDVLKEIKELDDVKEEIFGEMVKSSSCVTQIESMGASNVVPDRCQITVDVRTTPKNMFKIEVGDKVEVVSDVPPMITEDEKLIQGLEKSIEFNTGYQPKRIIKPQTTDSGFLKEAGVETIVLGGAESKEPHSNNESVSIDILEDLYTIYKHFANTQQ
ncbi:M20/M25/M40 family metallo-hydrolase [Methanonatronarchaeum sp. AMET-Sl]|uniref:M20 family metallopeptidase n=1 Tax=Methanonatronarchaeum sp. AMET-Sl TaxID=3037654 RepID=UPI00244E0EEE|nr:M20/M25/M40 family metallo-hydrolase [Methanonatronarchaeum sp. AMET-Sl]WGI17717.1 M20/M25/M40 family metallo-hydrolase [Methanonatronarchaeum sp. AMET-Sl]